jgi:uncharacterized protein YhaN
MKIHRNNYQALKEENTLLKEVNEAQIFTIEKYQKENESLTTQLAKANSDKERLAELLKEIYNKTKETKNPPPPAAMVRIRLTLQDCGITL